MAERRAEIADRSGERRTTISQRIKSDRAHRSIFERASARALGLNRNPIVRISAPANEARENDVAQWRRIACDGSCSVLLLAAVPRSTGAAFAFDNGQYNDVPPDIRAWFKSVMAPNGVPCCDISDGHRTEYDVRNGAYWVPIEGEWMLVPERAIIRDARQSGRRGRGLVRAPPRRASSSAASCRRTRCRRRRHCEIASMKQ